MKRISQIRVSIRNASKQTPDAVKDFIFIQVMKTIVLVGGLYFINKVIEHLAGK